MHHLKNPDSNNLKYGKLSNVEHYVEYSAGGNNIVTLFQPL